MKLKEARAQKLLTMAELAAASGVSLATIRNIEQGSSTPRLPIVRKIAGALGIDAGEIDEFRQSMEATARGRKPTGEGE